MNPFGKNAEKIPAKLPSMKLQGTDATGLAKNPQDQKELQDFVADADTALLQQDPLRARMILKAVALIFLVLLLWAAIAEVDEITRGEGKVIPSRSLQVLQSLDGGIVTEILVQEGQEVAQGQILLRLDQTRFVSNLRENQSQYYSLLAKAARLRALSDGKAFVVPQELAKNKDMMSLIEAERALYLSRQSELDATLSVVRQQLAQRNQELVEARARRDQAANGFELTSKELSLTKPMVASGAVSDVEILRLERDVSRYRGERDQAAAQIQRIQAAISESQSKALEVEREFRNRARSELSETTAKLDALGEGSVALSDKVKQSEIRSPVKGTVQRLLVKTVGGVVQPGRDIVEVVPSEDTLLIEARVLPKDIAFLRPEQDALVRLTAYDYAVYGGFEGTLEHISSDTVIDDKGNAFYVVRVRTKKASLDPKLPILPGMIAQADIMTGKKTVLSYLLKPILRGKYYALTER
jgi:adhesin transport system membrane fusion protein